MITSTTRESYTLRFQPVLDAIQAELDRLLTPGHPAILWQAMRHGVLNGGKRIRPVLLITACVASGGTIGQALPTACALELIHCYSLIHDDLPSMDNDDMRRGQPTVHKAYSEAMAILAGDALAAMAFGLITETPNVSADRLLHVVRELSRAASVEGLVNGQADDIVSANLPPTAEALNRIHQGKTGALFRFACRAGGILADRPQDTIDLLGQYGETLGLVFQIVDDLLDIRADSTILGKTGGKDQAQGKITFPAVYGIEQSEAILAEQTRRLDTLLNQLDARSVDTDALRYLVSFVQERQS